MESRCRSPEVARVLERLPRFLKIPHAPGSAWDFRLEEEEEEAALAVAVTMFGAEGAGWGWRNCDLESPAPERRVLLKNTEK